MIKFIFILFMNNIVSFFKTTSKSYHLSASELSFFIDTFTTYTIGGLLNIRIIIWHYLNVIPTLFFLNRFRETLGFIVPDFAHLLFHL